MTVAFLDSLIDALSDSAWTYPLLFVICAGDAVLPALPSETAMIVCGVAASHSDLSLGLVIAVGAAGAFVGDNTSYAAGRWIGDPIVKRFFSGERARERLKWAHGFLEERGSYVLVVARFVPGGRTATTFTAGLVDLDWRRRFAPWIFLAAILWASYGALLGYLGGNVFREHTGYALLLAFGIAAAVGLAGELVRRIRQKRR